MHEIKLHLGCGKRYLKGFIHVDLADYKHIDFRCDVRKLTKFKDESVDLIYASHVLEYFDISEAMKALKEWRRILKKGGILRLAVPNLDALFYVYVDYKAYNLIHGPLFGRWEIPGTNKFVYHKIVYNYYLLRRLLWKTLFKNVRRWDWRKVFVGEHEGFDDYSQSYIPHMDKENGVLISLNMEAEK